MKHLGDVTKIDGRKIQPVDVITFGSPCQDLSVAGLRKGLSGERSGLFHESMRIIKEMRDETGRTDTGADGHIRFPRYAIWENVQGALSSNKGADFRVVLEEMCRLKDKDAHVPELKGGGRSGNSVDASWEMAIPWLGDSIMQNISEYHSEEEGFVYSLISMETQHLNWFLNCSEKPIIPRPSKLSEILDLNCDLNKYKLSAKACQGILNRARKRGKKLPEILEYALIRQSNEGGAISFQERSGKPGGGKGILLQDEHTGTLSTLNNQSVVYGISPYASNAMLSKNPHSGIYEADTARTLDLNGGNPGCNQGGMAVVQNITLSDVAASRLAQDGRGGVHSQMMSDPEKNFVICETKVIGNGQTAQLGLHDKAFTLDCMHEQQAVLTYGLDRASFNQGQNAKFDFAVEEEKSPTLVAKGPGGAAVIQLEPCVQETTKE